MKIRPFSDTSSSAAVARRPADAFGDRPGHCLGGQDGGAL